jgi:peptide/nickel transport system substrate-binding protein
MIGAPRLVNPLLATSDTDLDLTHLVYSGLSRVDTQGKLVPDLASGWTANADSTIFTFTLKPDLHWQDGTPLTVDDVAFTLNLLQSADFPGDPALALPWHGVDITTVPTASLVLKLPVSNAAFPQYTTLGILPRHLWESVKASELAKSALNVSPVGSGPWRYAHISAPGSQVEGATPVTTTVPNVATPTAGGVLLVTNPFSPPTTGEIERIWFRPYPTFGAALTGLKLGEVQGLGHIPAENLAEVEAVPGITLHTQNLARYNMLILNVDSPLFDKVETRRAFEIALNRAVLADEKDHVSAPLDGPILPHSWAYNASCAPAQPYDPTTASQLLDEAGWKLGADGIRVRGGVTMTVVLAANSDVSTNVTLAQGIVDELRAVGVDARLAAVGRDSFLRDYLGPRAFHVALAGWEAAGADLDLYDYWHSSQAVTGGLNFAGWHNAAADKALATARSTASIEARAPLYCDFAQAFISDVPAVVLSTPLYNYATIAPAQGVTLPDADMLTPASRFDTIARWSLTNP